MLKSLLLFLIVFSVPAFANQTVWNLALEAMYTSKEKRDWQRFLTQVEADENVDWNYTDTEGKSSLYWLVMKNAPRFVRRAVLEKTKKVPLRKFNEHLKSNPSRRSRLSRSADDVLGGWTPDSAPATSSMPSFSYILPRDLVVDPVTTIKAQSKVQVSRIDDTQTFLITFQENKYKVDGELLRFNEHSSNLYLEVMDFITENPALLMRVLSDPSFKNVSHLREVLELVSARNLSLRFFEILLKNEFTEMSKKGGGGFLREETERYDLVRIFLERPKVKDYRQRVLFRLLKAAKKHKKFESFFAEAMDEIFKSRVYVPHEIRILAAATEQGYARATGQILEEKAPLLGGLFYLRFFCPMLVSSTLDQWIPAKEKVSPTAREFLSRMGKYLQFISNQGVNTPNTSPREESEWITPYFEKNAEFIGSLSAHLDSIEVDVDRNLVQAAARFYFHLLKTVSEFKPGEFESERNGLKILTEHIGAESVTLQSVQEIGNPVLDLIQTLDAELAFFVLKRWSMRFSLF